MSRMGDNCCIAVYDLPEGIERALQAVEKEGRLRDRVSVVGAVSTPEAETAGDGEKGSDDSFWRGIAARLESRMVRQPEDSRLLVVIGDLAAPLQEARGGGREPFLWQVLGTIGVPCRDACRYREAVVAGRHLVVVRGALPEVEQAHQTLLPTGPVDIAIHLG